MQEPTEPSSQFLNSRQETNSFQQASGGESRLHLALRGSGIGVWDWDLIANQVFYSSEWMQSRGCGTHEMMGGLQVGMDLVHPDDLDRIRVGRAEVIEGPLDHFESEYRVRHADGSWRWIWERSTVVRDENGKALRLVGCDMDTTVRKVQEFDEDRGAVGSVRTRSDGSEEKEAHLGLRNLSDRLNQILKNASVGIWDWDLDSDEVYWDASTMKILGVEPSRFSLKCDFGLKRLHPDDLHRITQIEHASLFELGHAHMEYRIVRDDGEIRHIYDEQIVHRNERHEVTNISGLIMDVTERKKIEKALMESEDKFQRVAEHVPGVVYRFIVHPDGSDEFAYVSSQVREMFELEPEDAIGDATAMWSRSHVEDREWLQKQVVASAQVLEPFLCEYRLQLPTKGDRWVQSFARPVRADNGDVIWDGIVVDHTDRKSAELALRDSQEQFLRTTENVPGMIFRYVLHPDSSHELPYVSSRSYEIFGISPEAARDNVDLLFERIHPDDLPRFQNAIEVSASNSTQFKQEYRIVFDDRTIWAETTSHPSRLPNGDVVWDGIIVDITHRKKIELALAESRLQFERMTENVPGMICRYVLHPDKTEELLFVSSQCRELFEIEPDEMMKDVNRLFGVIHEEDIEAFFDLIQHAAKTLQAINEEVRVVLPTKGLQWRQFIGQPTRIEGGATVFDGVVLDITQAKRSEMQLRLANEELATATKMKDQFLANMSHEIRTPLNAILGMTEGLQGGLYGVINAKQRASLGVVEQSGRHLLEVINDILDLATIESGKIKLERTDCDLKSLCESSLRLVAPQADRKNIQLSLNVPWNLPMLFVDEKRIRQVLINLLANAVKFTPEGGSAVLGVERISQVESQAADIVRISVIDSGVGIAAECIDSVFRPFVQVDSSLTRKHDGSGLGLSLVKQFVELHGGQVAVTSEPGVGSCFTVDLPYCQSPNGDRQSEETSKRRENPLPQGSGVESQEKMIALDEVDLRKDVERKSTLPTVLLAEDNDRVALAVKWYLEALGYPVHRAIDGAKAIDLALKMKPDLILMDIQMPHLDGLSAIKQIRRNPPVSDIPIIALTGLAMPDDVERCMAAGANGCLSKPCRMEALVQMIEALGVKREVAP